MTDETADRGITFLVFDRSNYNRDIEAIKRLVANVLTRGLLHQDWGCI